MIDRVSRSLAASTSRRRVFALAGGAAALALATAGQTGVAQQRRNPLENINVSGVIGAGKKVFSGQLDIKRFVARGDTLYAVGTLRGQLRRNKPPRFVSGKQVRIPVTAINGVNLASLGGAAEAVRISGQLVCDVLTLTLGPLDLNLLGLRIQLNQINLPITAITGSLLGDLLCAVVNLLSGGPLANLLAQLAALLNRILGQLG